MSGESSMAIASHAIGSAVTSVPRREQMYPGFEVAARALWPRKTAAHLGAAAGASERAAKFWLAGHRKPSAEAFKAINDKIMERRRSR